MYNPPPRQIPLPPVTSSPSHPPPVPPSALSAPSSRRSSASTVTPPSVANHSSKDRSTPTYASHRGSLQYEGESLDGSYSYVLSAPASTAPSPAHTPVGVGVERLSAVMERASLDGRGARPGPPPVPLTRPNASPPLRPDSPHIPPPLPSVLTPLPLPSLPSSSSIRRDVVRTDDANTVNFYLKQAIQAKDGAAISDLLGKANQLHVDPTLLSTAQSLLAEKRSENVHTLSFYLKQSIESKNKEGLKMALDKLQPLITDPTPPDLLHLIEEGRRLLTHLEKEAAQTVHFYLKQGIQLRNRDVIKQSLEKTPSVAPELLDKDLTTAAHELLTELDAQHLIKFYLSTAIKQRDEMALEQALEQAKKLKMGGEVAEVTEGYKLLAELRAKASKKRLKKPNGKKAKEEKFVLFGGPLIEAVRRSDQPIPKVSHPHPHHHTADCVRVTVCLTIAAVWCLVFSCVISVWTFCVRRGWVRRVCSVLRVTRTPST